MVQPSDLERTYKEFALGGTGKPSVLVMRGKAYIRTADGTVDVIELEEEIRPVDSTE